MFRSWFRHWATSLKVTGLILDGVIVIFHWHNPSGRTVALDLVQPLTEMSKLKWSRYRPGVAQKVGRGIALLFHDRGTRRWVSGQQHAPTTLYPRENTRYPFYRRLGGPQGRSGRAEYLVPTGIRSRTEQKNEYQEYILGGYGGRCLGQTTLPPSCTDCLEIWET